MYFIYNCNGEKRGNLNGYRTHKGASRLLNSPRSKLHQTIWREFYESKALNQSLTSVWRILGESLSPTDALY